MRSGSKWLALEKQAGEPKRKIDHRKIALAKVLLFYPYSWECAVATLEYSLLLKAPQYFLMHVWGQFVMR